MQSRKDAGWHNYALAEEIETLAPDEKQVQYRCMPKNLLSIAVSWNPAGEARHLNRHYLVLSWLLIN